MIGAPCTSVGSEEVTFEEEGLELLIYGSRCCGDREGVSIQANDEHIGGKAGCDD
jgi:hypothetical protein